MPAKGEYSDAEVIQYLRSKAGDKFAYRKLARIFHCGNDDMKATLAKLASEGKIEVETEASDRYQYYFIAKEVAPVVAHASRMGVQQYKQVGPAWSEVARRLAEFRAGPSVYAKLGDYNEEY